ncbi:MAG: UDP-N-acetylmuramoyl-tripeptide--D-alanyl-D-alanine ligase [Desulfovibrionaceae bacterium]
MNLSLAEVEHILTGATVTSGGLSVKVTGARTDSRLVQPGDVFFCIQGQRMDGHNFAGEAAKRGAAAIVAEQLVETGDAALLLVKDTVQAMGRLARSLRDKTTASVTAVTGSAGKTSVKELLAQVLSETMPVSKNPGNFNNQIGVPLSIFEASELDGAWVLEAGVSLPHDMDELGCIIAPDLAVLTNVAKAHTQGLGGLDDVARIKARLLAYLAEGGRGLVCRDYPELWREAVKVHPACIPFSTQNPELDFYCGYLGLNSAEDGRPKGLFSLKLPTFSAEIRLGVIGRHSAENIAAAAGAAHLLGMSAEDILRGLSQASAGPQRFRLRQAGGVTLVDDTYNANPLSMERSIQAARELAGDGPLVLALGEMLELGDLAENEHERLGRLAAEAGAALVLFHGDHGESVARGLEALGFKGGFAVVQTPADAALRLQGMDLTGGAVLFKGSRGRRMETFLTAAADRLEHS